MRNPFHPSRGRPAAILPLFRRRFQLSILLDLNLLLHWENDIQQKPEAVMTNWLYQKRRNEDNHSRCRGR
jgi:hypothetical protein